MVVAVLEVEIRSGVGFQKKKVSFLLSLPPIFTCVL